MASFSYFFKIYTIDCPGIGLFRPALLSVNFIKSVFLFHEILSILNFLKLTCNEFPPVLVGVINLTTVKRFFLI